MSPPACCAARPASTLAEILERGRAARVVPAGPARHAVGLRRRSHRQRHPWQEPSPRRHVRRPRDPLELLRSTASAILCSREQDAELFAATVGGLGLTGLILWAEICAAAVFPAPASLMERIRFADWTSSSTSPPRTPRTSTRSPGWTVWRAGGGWGGDSTCAASHAPWPATRPRAGAAPGSGCRSICQPGCINRHDACSVQRALLPPPARERRLAATVPYEPFFFPLDGIERLEPALRPARASCSTSAWCPTSPAAVSSVRILERVSASGETAALGVLKRFGRVPRPGCCHSPDPGSPWRWTSPSAGPRDPGICWTSSMRIVREAGGAVYPAKDARMSPESFRAFFPGVEGVRRPAWTPGSPPPSGAVSPRLIAADGAS